MYNKYRNIVLYGYCLWKGTVTKMAYVITDACIACGACAGDCPVSCIADAGAKYEIDADACIDCGTCQAACPVDAIEA